MNIGVKVREISQECGVPVHVVGHHFDKVYHKVLDYEMTHPPFYVLEDRYVVNHALRSTEKYYRRIKDGAAKK